MDLQDVIYDCSYKFSQATTNLLTGSYVVLVLVLFGIFPAAMAWSDRYSSSSSTVKLPQLVPGGRITLSLVMGGAGYIILSELRQNFGLS